MILLTGASGVVGSAVRKRLDDRNVVSLRHKRPIDGSADELIGDITRRRLGLSAADYRRVCREIEVVIHCAASVTMAGRAEDYERINIEGTRHVTRLADDAEARLVHVSTAFVCAAGGHQPLDYAESKRRAEEVVGGSSASSVILRPSIVAGDSVKGRISSPQGFHQVMATLLHGPIRIVPGDESTLVDFVPQDYVADVISHLVSDPSSPSEVWWLTSGVQAMRAGEAVRLVNALIEEQGLPGRPARLVADETIRRLFVPVFLNELPARQRARMKVLLHLAEQMRVDLEFPSSAGTIEESFGLALPDPAGVLESNLRALLTDVNRPTSLLAS